MEPLERRPGEDETSFRARQKNAEIRHILENVPATQDDFLQSPRWKVNRNQNLVFDSVLTIFPQYGKFNWIIAGGKPTWGPGGFVTQEDAQRDLWNALQEHAE